MTKTSNYQLTKIDDAMPADVVRDINRLADETDKVLTDELAKMEPKTNKNKPNGYPGLDVNGKISTAQLPAYKIGDKEVLSVNPQDNDTLKFDALIDKWRNVQSNIDRTPPGNVSGIAADTSSGSVTLKWTDPTDSDWYVTRVVRKIGSYPTSANDGTTVVTSAVRDQYKTNGYVDNGLVNGTQYYYQFFPIDTSQNSNGNPDNRVKATPQAVMTFGLSWNKATGQVLRLGDAIGRNVSTNEGIKTSDFSNVLPWAGMRRCNLVSDGTVTSYQGDPTFAHDGTKGNVMVEIPKFWFKKVPTATGFEFWIANGPAAGFIIHPAFYRDRGTGKADEVEKRYIGAFLGTKVGSKLFSYSNVIALNHTDIGTFREMAQSHGPGWGIEDFHLVSAVQLLYLVEYANFNSQAAIGIGDTNNPYGGVDGAVLRVGATATYGNSTYGKTVAERYTRADTVVSYRGIEDVFGAMSRYVDGVFITSGNAYLIGNRAFNNTGQGYTTTVQTGFGGDTVGQISDIFDSVEAGFLPKSIEGTSNSGLYDYGTYSASASIHVGGDGSDNFAAGIFRMNTANTWFSVGQYPRVSARLAY
ncbi:fibronectin type III domain-containing protein [Exiguobacterium sp. s130]|uniref:fibronectin type III domain-containing protein n=1 Tax=Exiguobacterium sp. s130 TaxID=2751190 RepID=UPI001BE7EC6B|nr:fibronectin type III domain-containing protein [Exiguobacterium sp. s130]